MSNIEKISIALTQDMAALVRQAVESGSYASASEVIREALRDWKTKQLVHRQQIEELRRLWNEGLNSGSGKFANVEELLEEANKRFAAKNNH